MSIRVIFTSPAPPGYAAGSRSLRCQPLREILEADGIAVLDAAVGGIEELEEDVGHPDLHERPAERLGAEIQEKLVARPRIDVDGLHRSERRGVLVDHPHRVPCEPPLPGARDEGAGCGIVWKSD